MIVNRYFIRTILFSTRMALVVTPTRTDINLFVYSDKSNTPNQLLRSLFGEKMNGLNSFK